ncbi:MAG: ribosome silencing factor [Acidobacteriota bacterium]|nr:ribosome silencing factor [Acidobacteriota bacterium]MDE2962976.1 ribosome silencing factor [Acidobacteriota bacterium]
MNIDEPFLSCAFEAARDKKALDLVVLDLREMAAFTDFFIICSGNSAPQIQAISNEIEIRLKKAGKTPDHIEGYRQAQWILMDYSEFVVHIFSPDRRSYYNLERLWRGAGRIDDSSPSATAPPGSLSQMS